MIWEKASAKINLTLDVVGKRDDGYHQVEMIMTMIDLADRISFEKIDEDDIILESNSGIVPNDEKNLIYKAASLLKSRFHIKQGIRIYLEKNIPVAAGLAGGSSDAAATFRGLNRVWQLALSDEQLMELGAEIGSDVPFCIKGGTALAMGRGEKIKMLDPIPAGWVVLAKLPISVSTKDIYQNLRYKEITKHPQTDKMIQALKTNDFRLIQNLLANVLEEVTFSLYPEVNYLHHEMKQFAENGVLMSGSGPTVYALVDKESKVNRIYNGLKGFCKQVYVVRLIGTPLDNSVQ